MANTTVVSVTVDGIGAVPVTVTERGEGRPFLLLQAGPARDRWTGSLICWPRKARPGDRSGPSGFGRTPRPEGLDSIRLLGRVYAGLLDELGLSGVTVVGTPSAGGSRPRSRCWAARGSAA